MARIPKTAGSKSRGRQFVQKDEDSPLVGRQHAFVMAYIADPTFNATRAYIAAGYLPEQAGSKACTLMKRPNIIKAIRVAMEERTKRMEKTADDVLREMDRIAFLDPRKFYNENGELIAIHELPDDVAAAMSAFEIVTVQAGGGAVEHVAKVRWHDKIAALKLSGQHRGMWANKTELSGPNGGPIQTEVVLNEKQQRLVDKLFDEEF